MRKLGCMWICLMIVAGLVAVSSGEGTHEPRVWTARETGTQVEATFVGVRRDTIVLRREDGQQTGIPFERVSDADKAYVRDQLPLRTWSVAGSGTTLDAHFAGVDGSQVVLLTPDYQWMTVRSDILSVADQAYIHNHGDIPMESLLIGEWQGVSMILDSRTFRYHHIEIRREGAAIRAIDTVSYALDNEQINLARNNRLRPSNVEHDPMAFAAVMEYNVHIDGQQLRLQGTSGRYLFKGEAVKGSEPRPFTLEGSFDDLPTILSGTIQEENGVEGLFFMARKIGYDLAVPTGLASGRRHQVASSLDPDLSFSLYIPNSYRACTPSPLLVNDNPGGGASPLSPEMAEELGWVMIGLTQSKNGSTWYEWMGNVTTAIFEVRKMLNIHPERYYFSGFSGGARRSSGNAMAFARHTAGIVCVGAGFWFFGDPPYRGRYRTVPTDVPVFFIVGESDFNNDEVNQRILPLARERGHVTELIVHPGGHT